MRRISFKTKLLLQATFATGAALLVAGSALLIFEYQEAKSRLVNRLMIQTDLIAENMTAALTFDDTDAAEGVLSAMAVDENITCASVFASDGRAMAIYCRDPEMTFSGTMPSMHGPRFEAGELTIVRPIILEKEQIGLIHVKYDLTPIYEDTRESSIAVALALLAGLVMMLLLTWRLQRVFARPVEELATTAKRFSEQNDYSVRAIKYSDDELGDLTDVFNQMLDNISYTKIVLSETNIELENRVFKRTEELAHAKKRAENNAASLFESEARIQAIFDATADSVIVVNDKGIVVSCNKTVEEMFGWSTDDLVGRNISTIAPEPHNNNHDRYLDRYLKTNEPRILGIEKEVTAVRKDGTSFPCALRVTEMTHDHKRSFVGVLQDIRERKERNEKLRNALEEAAAARELADTANQAKSEFLANMSHEIRTPMTAIMGYVELLLTPETSDQERIDHGKIVQRNGIHLLQIINDILDISKIEAGKLEIEIVEASPLQIIADVISLMRVRAEERGIELNVEFGSAIPYCIDTDPTRLKQIVLNLVSNAIKFTDKGSVTISTRFEEQIEDTFFHIDVIDTGIGMTQEQIEELFEPFTQADASVTRRFGGTGLGLTISKHLAELLGGDITIQSEVGTGSTFSLALNLGVLNSKSRVENPDEAVLTQALDKCDINKLEQSNSSIAYSGRVLLAEDGKDNQRLLSTILRKAGFEVEIAENGKIAVDAALAEFNTDCRFDLILMDMQMPVMDGYTATKKLRDAGYDLPIIALTAHAMASDRDKCLSAGCDDYAVKPIKRDLLLEIVSSRILQARQQRGLAG